MPTPFLACPTQVVEAPVDVVWNLVTNFERWGDFYDCRVITIEPLGPAAVGQRMIGEAGPRFLHMKALFEFKRIDESKHEVEIDGQLPLGLVVHEDMDMIPITPSRCRVNYHCNFAIPNGWRGFLFRRILAKEMTRSPQDSIDRLKRAAEEAWAKKLSG
jgi:hypothetical protein